MKTADRTLDAIEAKILEGERLSFADGVHLFREATPLQLSAWADLVRRRPMA